MRQRVGSVCEHCFNLLWCEVGISIQEIIPRCAFADFAQDKLHRYPGSPDNWLSKHNRRIDFDQLRRCHCSSPHNRESKVQSPRSKTTQKTMGGLLFRNPPRGSTRRGADRGGMHTRVGPLLWLSAYVNSFWENTPIYTRSYSDLRRSFWETICFLRNIRWLLACMLPRGVVVVRSSLSGSVSLR